jgi:hypothetical protein
MLPPSMQGLFKFLELHPDQMFVFIDSKACLTYERDVGSVVYLIGNFDRDKDQKYNTHVALMAKEAQMN